MVKLLKDPQAPWDRPALTTHGYQNHGVRSEGWRYIRYADGGEELYDEKNDPMEWKNLAGEPQYSTIKAELARWMPEVNVPTPTNAGKGGGDTAKSKKKAKKQAAKKDSDSEKAAQ
jgi:hypothetical protein